MTANYRTFAPDFGGAMPPPLSSYAKRNDTPNAKR